MWHFLTGLGRILLLVPISFENDILYRLTWASFIGVWPRHRRLCSYRNFASNGERVAPAGGVGGWVAGGAAGTATTPQAKTGLLIQEQTSPIGCGMTWRPGAQSCFIALVLNYSWFFPLLLHLAVYLLFCLDSQHPFFHSALRSSNLVCKALHGMGLNALLGSACLGPSCCSRVVGCASEGSSQCCTEGSDTWQGFSKGSLLYMSP